MLRRGFYVIIPLILTISVSILYPTVSYAKSSGEIGIFNNTKYTFQILTCNEQQKVGEFAMPQIIKPTQTVSIPSHYLRSSNFDALIDFYLLPSIQNGIQYHFELCNFILRKPNLSLYINAYTNFNLIIEGDLVKNGISKTLPTFRVDNTFHPLGSDVAYFYNKDDLYNPNNQLYKPKNTGLVYLSLEKPLKELCINSVYKIPDEMFSFNYNSKEGYLSFIQLSEGDFEISPAFLNMCIDIPTKQQITISIYESQYVIIENSHSLNPLYHEKGVLIYKTVDKNNHL